MPEHEQLAVADAEVTVTPWRRSWEAASRSSLLSEYFLRAEALGLPHARADRYHPATAWWLLELCRFADLALAAPAEERAKRNLHPAEVLAKAALEQVAEIKSATAACVVLQGEAADGPYTVVSFRGTCNREGWRSALRFWPQPWPQGGRVHGGFLADYRTIRDELHALWPRLEAPVLVTGHSSGAAVGLMVAAELPVQKVYTFGAPRTGDRAFASRLADVPVYNILNLGDLVGMLPPACVTRLCHIGEQRYLAHEGGEYTFDLPWHHELRVLGTKLSGLLHPANWRQAPVSVADHGLINYLARLEEDILIRHRLS